MCSPDRDERFLHLGELHGSPDEETARQAAVQPTPGLPLPDRNWPEAMDLYLHLPTPLSSIITSTESTFLFICERCDFEV